MLQYATFTERSLAVYGGLGNYIKMPLNVAYTACSVIDALWERPQHQLSGHLMC